MVGVNEKGCGVYKWEYEELVLLICELMKHSVFEISIVCTFYGITRTYGYLHSSLKNPKGINIYNHNLVNINSNDLKPLLSQVIEPSNAAYTLLQIKATSIRH